MTNIRIVDSPYLVYFQNGEVHDARHLGANLSYQWAVLLPDDDEEWLFKNSEVEAVE